jgi:hypothetical protein
MAGHWELPVTIGGAGNMLDIIGHIRNESSSAAINILKAEEQSARSSLANYFLRPAFCLVTVPSRHSGRGVVVR